MFALVCVLLSTKTVDVRAAVWRWAHRLQPVCKLAPPIATFCRGQFVSLSPDTPLLLLLRSHLGERDQRPCRDIINALLFLGEDRPTLLGEANIQEGQNS